MISNLDEAYFAEQYDFLNKVNEDINELNNYITYSSNPYNQEITKVDEIETYYNKFEKVTGVRETYISTFNDIFKYTDSKELNRDFTGKWKQKFTHLKKSITDSYESLENGLLIDYSEENISKTITTEKNNKKVIVSCKIKMFSYDLIYALKITSKYSSVKIKEIDDPEDNYRFIVEAVSNGGDRNDIYEKSILINKFIRDVLNLTIKSEIYRPFVYNNFSSTLLTKIENLFPEKILKMDEFEPHEWQKEALKRFLGDESNVKEKDSRHYALPKSTNEDYGTIKREISDKYHMICESATGTGKTRFALMCIESILKVNPDAKIRIIVPKIVLMLQWAKELQEKLHVPKEKIRLMGSKMCSAKERRDFNMQFSIYVSNTAREEMPSDLNNSINRKNTSNFIIADECHHYYSPANFMMFEGLHRYNRKPDYNAGYYSLALSATPYSYSYVELELLKAFGPRMPEYITRENVMFEILGPNEYKYNVIEAVADGVVSPIKIVNIDCRLNDAEMKRYKELTKQLMGAVSGFESSLIKLYSRGKDIPPKYNDDLSLFKLAMNIAQGEQKIAKEIKSKLQEFSKAGGDKNITFEKWIQSQDPYYAVVHAAMIVFGINIKMEDVMYNCEARKRKCIDLAIESSENKTIVFNETIKSTEFIYDKLVDILGEERVLKFHSKIDLRKIMKDKIISDHLEKGDLIPEYFAPFKNGNINLLITAKILDEGVDVPKSSVGIIYQGTENQRQNLQRLGRIIRKNKGDSNKVAELYWFYNDDCGQKPFLYEYLNEFDKVIKEEEQTGHPLSDYVKKLKKGLELIMESYMIVKSIPSVGSENVPAELK